MTAEPWVSVEDAAKHLGVAKDSVYRWIDSKGLPAHKIGRLWKFKLSAIDKWVRAGGASRAGKPSRGSPTDARQPRAGAARWKNVYCFERSLATLIVSKAGCAFPSRMRVQVPWRSSTSTVIRAALDFLRSPGIGAILADERGGLSTRYGQRTFAARMNRIAAIAANGDHKGEGVES